MKPAILKRAVSGKNFSLRKKEPVYVAQMDVNNALVKLDRHSNIEYPVPTEALEFISDEVKIEYHVARESRRDSAMFYFGKHIATVSKGHRKIYVESAGEMKAALAENSKNFSGKDLLAQLNHNKVTDRGIGTMAVNDLIIMNNWFRLFDTESGGGEEIISHNYSDAIKQAKELINKD